MNRQALTVLDTLPPVRWRNWYGWALFALAEEFEVEFLTALGRGARMRLRHDQIATGTGDRVVLTGSGGGPVEVSRAEFEQRHRELCAR